MLESKYNSSDVSDYDVGKLEAVQNKCFNVENNRNNVEGTGIKQLRRLKLVLGRVAGEFHFQLPWPTFGLRLSFSDLRPLHFNSLTFLM